MQDAGCSEIVVPTHGMSRAVCDEPRPGVNWLTFSDTTFKLLLCDLTNFSYSLRGRGGRRQSLLGQDEDQVPILVGGAAVEILTGGAYTTGDSTSWASFRLRFGVNSRRMASRKQAGTGSMKGRRFFWSFRETLWTREKG